MNLKLIKREDNNKKYIDLGDEIIIGAGDFTIIAGPCAIESKEQIEIIIEYLNKLQIRVIRGGTFKPRTSPYSFQGLGFKGLKILRKAADRYHMKIISEILDPRDVKEAESLIDIYQIGSRNMNNYSLLREIGKTKKPVMLKRGMAATVEEWLMAAEYIALEGNDNIILCERGIRTFENYTRNTLDLTAVPVVKKLSYLPVIVDPSHGTGKKELVIPLSRAAVAVGADGIMIEVHPNPCEALSDGEQSLDLSQLEKLVKDVRNIHACVNDYS